MSIAAIARNALLKFVGGQVVHQLSEDSWAGIHPLLSALDSRLAAWTPDRFLPPTNSNRKNQNHPQLHDCAGVIPQKKILAGQQ